MRAIERRSKSKKHLIWSFAMVNINIVQNDSLRKGNYTIKPKVIQNV